MQRLLEMVAGALAERIFARLEGRLNALLDTAHDAALARMDRATAARVLASKKPEALSRPLVFRTNNGKVL